MGHIHITASLKDAAMQDAAARLVDTVIASQPPGSDPQVITIITMMAALSASARTMAGLPPGASIDVLANVTVNAMLAITEGMERDARYAGIDRRLIGQALLEKMTTTQASTFAHALMAESKITAPAAAPRKEAS